MEKQSPYYKNLMYWLDNYGKSGAPDDRAVHDFMICEATEAINSLRAELVAIAEGAYNEANFDQLVGPKRKMKHGSYDAWAKLMLLWMASFKG